MAGLRSKCAAAARLALTVASAAWLAGCAAFTTAPGPAPPSAAPEAPANPPPSPLPEELLLDVGIAVEPPAAGDRHDADLRRAEGSYVAGLLKTALQSAGVDHAACPQPQVPETACEPALGHWGAVRILSRSSTAIDLAVAVRVEESDGTHLALRVRAVDARGALWLDKRYRRTAIATYHHGQHGADPFASLYAAVAGDLTSRLLALPRGALREIRSVAELRFADGLLPGAFGRYLRANDAGELEIRRLPAADNRLLADADRVRGREHLFIDTVDEYFADFSDEVAGTYAEWQRASYDAAAKQRRLALEAQARERLGSIHLLAGLAKRPMRGGLPAARGQAGPSKDALASLVDGAGLLHGARRLRQAARKSAEGQKAEAAGAGSAMLPAALELERRQQNLERRVAAQVADARHALREAHSARREPLASPVPQPALFAPLPSSPIQATVGADPTGLAALSGPLAPRRLRSRRDTLRGNLAMGSRRAVAMATESFPTARRATALMQAGSFGAPPAAAPTSASRRELARAYTLAAEAHRQGNAAGAIAALERVAAHESDITKAEFAAAQFNLAQLRFRQDDVAGAWEAMRAGTEAAAMQAAACAAICSPAARAQAAAVAEAVLAGGPQVAAQGCVAARRRSGATELTPRFWSQVHQVRDQIDKGRFSAALTAIDALLAEYRKGAAHAVLWREKASAYSASGNRAGAIQALEKMLGGKGTVPKLSERRAIYDLAHLHLHTSDHARSLCYQQLWLHQSGFARKVCRTACGNQTEDRLAQR